MDFWFEKLEFGHYRAHYKENDPEQIAEAINTGFSASKNNPEEFVKDYVIDDPTLNFGITMADCFNQLFNNQCFITAYLHLNSLRKHSPKAMKEVRDNLSESEILGMVLSHQDLDEFLYTYAENYSKALVDEARLHLEKGLDEFAIWLKGGSVSFRKGLLDVPADYYVLDRKIISGDSCAFVFVGYGLYMENNEAYLEWVDRFENDECWVGYLREHLTNNAPKSDEFYYSCYYYYTGDNATDDLFKILNEKDSHYSTRTKRLIKKVLNDHSREDAFFARELQRKYDGYKSLASGMDITFEPTAATDTTTAQPTPQIEGPEQEQPKQASKVIDETRQKLFNASEELIKAIVDFIAENYDKKFIVDYFKRILINPNYKSNSMKLVDALAYNRSKYEYKGLKVMHFCHIIGFLITTGVIKDQPKNIAGKLYEKLDKYPEAKYDPQNNNNVTEKRIDSLRLYIQDAKDFFSGKSRKTIEGCNFMKQVFDDMQKKTRKKPKTT